MQILPHSTHEINMSYYYGKAESIALTLLIFNVPGLLLGAGIVGLLWWLT